MGGIFNAVVAVGADSTAAMLLLPLRRRGWSPVLATGLVTDTSTQGWPPWSSESVLIPVRPMLPAQCCPMLPNAGRRPQGRPHGAEILRHALEYNCKLMNARKKTHLPGQYQVGEQDGTAPQRSQHALPNIQQCDVNQGPRSSSLQNP